MEYWTDEEILSGQISNLRSELKELQEKIENIKNPKPPVQEEIYIYEKSSMDFPEGYVRYTCVPQISYKIDPDIKTTNKQKKIIKNQYGGFNMNEMGQKYAEYIAEVIKEERKEKVPYDDPVNHPAHYCDGGIEVIDFIKAKNLDFCLGNAVKYISRSGKKHEADMTAIEKTIQDIEKAIWYCNKEIEWLKQSK